MDEFSKILTDKWKDIIESINVGGESRKIKSVNFTRTNFCSSTTTYDFF